MLESRMRDPMTSVLCGVEATGGCLDREEPIRLRTLFWGSQCFVTSFCAAAHRVRCCSSRSPARRLLVTTRYVLLEPRRSVVIVGCSRMRATPVPTGIRRRCQLKASRPKVHPALPAESRAVSVAMTWPACRRAPRALTLRPSRKCLGTCRCPARVAFLVRMEPPAAQVARRAHPRPTRYAAMALKNPENRATVKAAPLSVRHRTRAWSQIWSGQPRRVTLTAVLRSRSPSVRAGIGVARKAARTRRTRIAPRVAATVR